jgi:hypothetical protein
MAPIDAFAHISSSLIPGNTQLQSTEDALYQGLVVLSKLFYPN